jgi:hypothetical protein
MYYYFTGVLLLVCEAYFTYKTFDHNKPTLMTQLIDSKITSPKNSMVISSVAHVFMAPNAEPAEDLI